MLLESWVGVAGIILHLHYLIFFQPFHLNHLVSLFTVMGMTPRFISSRAISRGSIDSVFTNTGAPIKICRALAPTILARSYLVYISPFK